MIVYDLDGDGLPEIVLGAINTVMRTRGDFHFENEPLMSDNIADEY